MSHGHAAHPPSLSDLDAWLIGYPGYAPSPVHIAVEVGEASGLIGPPSLNQWRAMQASAVATDLGLAALVLTLPLEPYAVPVAQRGFSWHLSRFAVARYFKYGKMAAGPVGIAGFFVLEALKNWERDPNLWTDRQASWAAAAAVFD